MRDEDRTQAERAALDQVLRVLVDRWPLLGLQRREEVLQAVRLAFDALRAERDVAVLNAKSVTAVALHSGNTWDWNLQKAIGERDAAIAERERLRLTILCEVRETLRMNGYVHALAAIENKIAAESGGEEGDG